MIKLSIIIWTLAVMLSGCSWIKHSQEEVSGDLPPSHSWVKETVIKRAVESLTLPESIQDGVSIVVDGDNDIDTVLKLVVDSVLTDKGFTIQTQSNGDVRLIISLEKLSIVLTPSGEESKMTQRNALARIVVTVTDKSGRKVFRSEGVYEDNYESHLVAFDSGDPHIDRMLRRGPVMRYFQPVVIGACMTVFAWMLYSFRG